MLCRGPGTKTRLVSLRCWLLEWELLRGFSQACWVGTKEGATTRDSGCSPAPKCGWIGGVRGGRNRRTGRESGKIWNVLESAGGLW